MGQVYLEGNNLQSGYVARSSVCWGSVFAGVIAGMVVQVVLGLLGLAIGLNVFNPGQHSYTGLGVGSTIWMVASALLSGYSGGWVATALANMHNRFEGIMHGILAWGVFMVIALYMFESGMGTLVSGTFNLSSAAITGASQGVAQTASRQQGVAAVREQAGQIERNLSQPPTQAEQKQQRIQQEQAANTAAKATWATFIVALLSLGASALGGVVGLSGPLYRRTAVSV